MKTTLFKPFSSLTRILTLAVWGLASGMASAEVSQVDNGKLVELLATGVPVVDIRTREEWAKTGVVEGSHLLTFFDRNGNYDVKAWLKALDQIVKPDQPFILICESGGRTGVVSRFLDKKAGYTAVHDVSKGIRAWIDAGRPVVPANL